MRKNFGAKTWLYPMPVLIVGTYGENGIPNAMNAAWGGIYDTNQDMVCLADDHKTTENIKRQALLQSDLLHPRLLYLAITWVSFRQMM